MTSSETVYNPIRYAGYYYDYEIDKYYLVNRYYNGATGRFMTEDPYWNVNNMLYGSATNSVIRNVYYPAVVQSGNRFGYCMGNSIKFIDSSGFAGFAFDENGNVIYYEYEYNVYAPYGRFDTIIH